LWGQERYERWGPFGATRNWEGSRFHGDGRFFPVNAGLWSVWLDASERGQELRFQGRDIPSRWGRLAVTMGDFTVHDPRQDPLRVEFQPAVWLRGASLRLDREAFSVSARGGVQTERRGMFGWGRSPVFGGSCGLTLSGPTGDDALWKADWDRQEDTAPRGGVQLLRFFWGREPANGWTWLGQTRFSRRNGSGRWGNSVILGAGYGTSSFVGKLHLRRLSPSFQNLGLYQDPHANEWGTRLEVSYRPRRQLLVGTSWDWARDIEPRGGRVIPEKRLITRFTVSSPLGRSLSLQGSVGYRNRSTTDLDSLLVDQGAITWSGTVSWNSAGAKASLGLNRSLFRDPTSTGGDWHENRYSTNGLVRISETLRAEILGWLVHRRFLDGRWASRERKVEGRVHWEPKSRQRGWLRLGRDHLRASEAGFSRDQWELGAGWTQPLPWELSLEAEALFFVRAGALETDRTRFNLRISRRFIFGGGGLGLGEGLPEFGSVDGVVYEDLNGNGYRDPGENGIPGLVLRLGSGPETATDERGAYRFPEAATQVESITLDVARLPTRYLAPESDRTVVNLVPGENAKRNYAVRPAASVVGRVVLDLGHRSQGVPDVLIRIPGTHHDAFTDPEGRFYIPGLEAGSVTLEVTEWSLPPNARIQGSPSKQVVLRAGRAVNAGVIVLEPKEARILQMFRPGAG
jgi:hypothetical protein